jgi:uncharacterized protein (TIGR02147 family)
MKAMNALGADTKQKLEIEGDFRLWLQSELTRRCKKNARYSLRAFAELLKMDASSVSQILSGKRKPSSKLVDKICSRLGANPLQKDFYIKQASKKKSLIKAEALNFEIISLDAFAVISEWYHYAILVLVDTEGFKSDPAAIARSLGITVPEAQIALERLVRLGLLKVHNGVHKRVSGFVTNFEPGMTSQALKSLQKQVISMALEAVDNVPQEDKDITSITMAIDPTKLPEARKRIARFRRELCAFLEDGKRTRVYHLGLQLYPVSNLKK